MFGLFKKKKIVPEFNFSNIGTDMHSHIIPGIDDGAQTINDSIALAKKFKALGFKKLIATPHIMADYFRNTPDSIHRALDVLRKGLQEIQLDLEVDAAAEYYLDETLERKVKQKEILSFGSNYLLFELSYINAPQNLYDIIKLMQDSGYKPVLAHPERYPYYYGSFESYHQIRETGCLLQMNSIALTGYYGSGAKKVAEEMVENHLVDFIGSDMHHLKHAAALEDSLSTPLMQRLLSQHQLNNVLI
ncbi:MAG: capsular biosynthesis protein [Chryseobacterium sp.]|uniref:protein-tyrosine-phosphatase n=1 Tax=Pedobacter agri TaxID=454586 RepID=A0A9X3DFU0_9SPHI|nr:MULTISPECIES: CpsB/CapC family capsule biosynthesis tyrosine phosphatase [Pedobacter]AZI25511.1 capsular biosynthesis protein [Pedobacter sp. G11]MCX3266899.1 capsular biosynthesis protein [Pedobacter agri]RZJ85823.1 MAG: capsular biosynthesis protein [Chryseobacterium sp.]